ncbi:amidohydrolase [Micromonospora sagamiensis]|uniref:Hippurate hydrolase n=1 Tax=Micromonospora sagamiensis TaxID=47875 RepID=A0A562WEF8_9ACTN|nr:amidohydrolase [Micromonospora sagamiensis]TWJ28606.1 hippurate hydrolase [Micromonospora sagamiensis]
MSRSTRVAGPAGAVLSRLWSGGRLAPAVSVYHHLHAHPELSGQEHRTAEFVEARLADLGIETFRCGGTGVVGILRNGEGPVVAYRADLDGLPIQEESGVAYASTDTGRLPDGSVSGVMHACGHDLHVTVALATAGVLVGNRAAWAGTVVWIFQPAEETAAGAAAMVDDGLWEKAPRPEAVLAQHVTSLPSDQVRIGVGNVMNLGDSWRVRLRGRGAHGARPHESIDPIVLGAHLVTRLQTVVSRQVEPGSPVVLTVGTFHAGTKENVIPDEATLSLNIRTPDAQTRETVLSAVRRMIVAEAVASGAPEPTIEEISRFPRCFNAPEQAGEVAAVLDAVFGPDNVARDLRATGSEDVGWLADAIGVPLVFWMFGAYRPGRGPDDMPSNHTPRFAPEPEYAIPAGVRAALAALGTRLDVPS